MSAAKSGVTSPAPSSNMTDQPPTQQSASAPMAGASVPGADVEGVSVTAVRLCDLFPSGQITAQHRAYKYQRALQLVHPLTSRFGRRLHDALAQLFAQTVRRHRRLAIEDDEFFHMDKVQRVEQARKYSRDGTRLYQPFPSRKKPLSTLLRPSILSSDKRFALQFDPATTTAAPATAASDSGKGGAGVEVKGGGGGGGGNAFPGSIPVSMMEADIRKLYDGAYFFVWAPKTNGLRFFAVGCHFGHEPWLLLVNRAQQVFALPGVIAPDVLYDGTVLDGELVPTHDGRFAFLAYDCAMSCGVPCSEYNYLVRLQIASVLVESWNNLKGATPINNKEKDAKQAAMDPLKSVLAADAKNPLWQCVMADAALTAWRQQLKESNSSQARQASQASQASRASQEGGQILVSEGDVCVIDWRVKRVFSPERFIEMLTLELPLLDHDTDGFIPTAVEPPIQIGQTQTIFKVKRATDHTIDFLLVVLNAATASATEPLIVDLVAMHNKGLSQVEAGVLWDTVTLPTNSLPNLAARLGFNHPNSSPAAAGSWVAAFGGWLNGKIMECRYDAARRSWGFEYVRGDKSTPNKLSTADKTWQNIQENLSLLQIFPEGSMTREQRALLHDWETSHPNWKTTPTAALHAAARPAPAGVTADVEALTGKMANLSVGVATATAPAPLSRLIKFN